MIETMFLLVFGWVVVNLPVCTSDIILACKSNFDSHLCNWCICCRENVKS